MLATGGARWAHSATLALLFFLVAVFRVVTRMQGTTHHHHSLARVVALISRPVSKYQSNRNYCTQDNIQMINIKRKIELNRNYWTLTNT